MNQTRKVALRLPADRDMMMLVRLTTSGVVMRAGLTLDAVDDVKMAVDEAANCLIRFSRCNQVQIDYELGLDELSIRLMAQPCEHAVCDGTSDELDTIAYILESMVDKAQLLLGDCGLMGIALSKQLPAPLS